ncbi:Uncharacterised protein [Legionella beliardensis]|uniref:Uncharacterized protein n=1 Tax=Legionella beliardensis TaxID=91822 RepID=A0A378I2S3_9GAMM|nr:hypothetical protein [Legionella beliardensis]STX29479.1 Uncharacterised protein [Legionella beliardensis]
MYKDINVYVGYCLFIASLSCFAEGSQLFSNTIYVGLTGGYGSTTWEGLVPADKNKNGAMTISTPIHVNEGGFMWGFFSGYEFSPHFAIESHYRHYPSAQVDFDKDSLFAFDHHNTTHFTSHTETIGLMGKIMLIVPNTSMQIYSGAGVAGIHRYDVISNDWRKVPTFDIGFNLIGKHFMFGLGGNYTAGYGESEIDPAKDYFPFLYSVFMNLAYRF